MSAHSIVALWVSTVVFAHVFALYWLIRTALIGRTSIFAKRRRIKRFQEVAQCQGGPASAHGRGVDALADVGAEGRDQQKALASLEDGTPFVQALKILKPVQSSESLTAEEDEVPDMSPVACATLKQHMSVAPETFDMEWQEMGCSYNIQGTAKVVLQDIWGRAYPGEMQEDNFVPTMTANETLSFYASVILPSSWSSSSKCERVLEVLDAVGLGHCHRTLVGAVVLYWGQAGFGAKGLVGGMEVCVGRCLTFTWVGILIGMLYYGLPDDGTSLRSRLNLTYLALSFVVLVTTPFQVVCALCFSFTLYGMAGLREGGEHIIKFGCIITLVYLISVQVLHAAAMVAPNQDTAFMLSIIWTTIQILASSFFVSFNEVITNFWLTQLRYISALYFGLEAMVLNEFYGLTYDCSAGIGNSGYMNFIMTAFPKLTNAQKSMLQTLERPQPGCVLDTAAVINYFDFARPFGVSVGILLGYLGVVHCLTFAFMMLSARKEAR
eukprot:gene5626-5865_t